MNARFKTTEAERSSATHRAPRSRVRTTNEMALPMHPALALARTRGLADSELTYSDILEIQRSIGNRAVQSLLQQRIESTAATEPSAGPAIQAKALVGVAGNEYEREADDVAHQVVTSDATPTGSHLIQRQALGFESEIAKLINDTPAPNQQQNQLAAPHIEAPDNQGQIEMVIGPHAANAQDLAQEIPDIANLIALIKKLMLLKTQKKQS